MWKKKFSIVEAISFGWKTAINNLCLFIVGFVFNFIGYVVGYIAPNIITTSVQEGKLINVVIFLLFCFIFTVIGGFIVGFAFVKTALRFYDTGGKIKFGELFSGFSSLFFKYLLGNIVYFLIVFGGLILVYIPLILVLFSRYLFRGFNSIFAIFSWIIFGIALILLFVSWIIWILKFCLFGFLIVDKNLGVIDSLKMSSEITKGTKWKLLVLFLLIGIMGYFVNLSMKFGGFFALTFAIVYSFTISIYSLAMAFIYRKLLTQSETEVERI
jgi:hypothetical protein